MHYKGFTDVKRLNMYLHGLSKAKGNRKRAKRIGRGIGSGKGGHTVGRGAKGQKARNKVSAGFEGGQTPLYKRLPQLGGFRNPTSKDIVGVALFKLDKFRSGTKITPQKLVESNILKKVPRHGVKILANGDFSKALTFNGPAHGRQGFLFSKVARK